MRRYALYRVPILVRFCFAWFMECKLKWTFPFAEELCTKEQMHICFFVRVYTYDAGSRFEIFLLEFFIIFILPVREPFPLHVAQNDFTDIAAFVDFLSHNLNVPLGPSVTLPFTWTNHSLVSGSSKCPLRQLAFLVSLPATVSDYVLAAFQQQQGSPNKSFDLVLA